ncbi:mas-related G-protein coupled receptor member H-like [Erythrolamprus reginae]|uniref:mas-related G-protein coupled receptor member H-like n=1 Tax=Erythrolamprus reginae TaxID=121349 RepID=UPI00396CDDFE
MRDCQLPSHYQLPSQAAVRTKRMCGDEEIVHKCKNHIGTSIQISEIIAALQKSLGGFQCEVLEQSIQHFYQLFRFSKSMIVLFITIFISCCIGIPLNGIVIWLLGFQIKRNPFTVLILNLAIADFGFLLILAIVCICFFIPSMLIVKSLFTFVLMNIMGGLIGFTYINSLFLLTAISIDRCVCVLFPIWHRCSRPKHLSSAVCTFLWICSFLLEGIANILKYVFDYSYFFHVSLIVASVLCLPLITASTVILFIKICLKPKQMKRRRLLVMILITLLCFLIFNLPLNIYGFYASYFYESFSFQSVYLNVCMNLGASLNSSVNPIIYYLVGRKKQVQTRQSIKVVFQRVFREDEPPESTDNATNRVSTPL